MTEWHGGKTRESAGEDVGPKVGYEAAETYTLLTKGGCAKTLGSNPLPLAR
jgi:hypothetical protein